jgi:hypothetical protein
MQTFSLIPGLFLLLAFFPAWCAAESLSIDEMQSRMAAISKLTSSSASGHFVVIGTNRLENVGLVGWCEDLQARIETITGLPVPFKQRTVRLIVHTDGVDAPHGVVARHARQSGELIHRIHLRSAAAAYERRGRQAICHAIMAGYVGPSLSSILELPPWLWKGMEQNLSPDIRARNMEQALARWRAGELDSTWQIIGPDGPDPRQKALEGQERLAAYGVFVHWLAALPDRRTRFKALFAKVAGGNPITVAVLESLIPETSEAVGLDEAWDRWLLRQEYVVYAVGAVSTRIMDQLRAELLLHPGACCIPLDASLPRAAVMADLVPRRKAAWIAPFVREKRARLDLLAVGRSEALKKLVSQFGEFLSGLESDVPDTLLLEVLNAANLEMRILADQVEAAGGLLCDTWGGTLNEKENRSAEP